MAWPTTGAGSLASGYMAEGVTTIVWGSRQLIGRIAGQAPSGIGVTVGIVLRFNQRSLVDNIKLPNGDGLTTTRVQIVDGMQWDVTVRDDTGLTSRPRIGTNVRIVDGAGMIATQGLFYNGTVCESGYDTAPKQPGEMTLTLENLILVESQTGSGTA